MRERWVPGGERRLRAGALPRRPPLFTRAARCVSLLCGLRRRGGSGVPSGELRTEGAGTRSRAGWGCGLRGTETLLGVRARDPAAGPRPSIVPAALAAGPRGVLLPGPLRRPAGQLARPRALPAFALGPQPGARRPSPGRRVSRAGWGWGCGPGRRAPGRSGSRGLPASRGRGGLASRSRPGALGSPSSVSAPSPATPRSPPLK